jgi:hypothetical protein
LKTSFEPFRFDGSRSSLHGRIELVFLLGEEPQQGPGRKREPAAVHHICDGASHHKIQLQFRMVMALNPLQIPRRFGEIEQAVILPAKLEVCQHADNIR